VALEWFAAGRDVADAMHLASVQPAEKFAILDEKLVRQAKKLEGATVIAA
jgi:hypothetical protein